MVPYRSLLLPLLVASCAVPRMHAADKAQLAAHLKSAAEHSSLDSVGLQPWHMALDITLFDVDGKNPKPATVELWAAGSNMKMVESVAGVQVTTVRNNDKLSRTSAQAPEFIQLESLIEQILHPIPDEFLQTGVRLNEDKLTVAKTPMDCIEPTFPSASSTTLITRPFSFCVIRDTDSLAITYGGAFIEFRQQTLKFQSREISSHLQVLAGKTLRADAKITKLETFTPKSDDFVPTSQMALFDGPVEAKPTDRLDIGISKTPPIYPAMARADHVSGSVDFDALIGTDGRVTSLKETGHADSLLSVAAETAVRQWIYRPFLICGIPIPVKTT